MIRGVIFDVDGTLLDSLPIWYDAAKKYLKTLSITAEQNLGETLFNMDMQQGAEYIKKNYCLNIEVPEIIDGVNNILKNFYKNEVQLKKGVSEVLGFLKTQHIPSAIATATNKILIDSAFNRLCIDKYFIDILTCSDVGKSKSEPDIYIALQQKMGFPPEEILICEDSAEAAYTAANAGFLTAGIYDAQNEYQQMKLKKICKFYLPDFTFFPYAAII